MKGPVELWRAAFFPAVDSPTTTDAPLERQPRDPVAAHLRALTILTSVNLVLLVALSCWVAWQYHRVVHSFDDAAAQVAHTLS